MPCKLSRAGVNLWVDREEGGFKLIMIRCVNTGIYIYIDLCTHVGIVRQPGEALVCDRWADSIEPPNDT